MLPDDSSSNIIDKKIAALLHLAKKDKFVGYRDLIYYTAAQIEMERKNYDDAYTYLKKSIKYNTIDNPAQRSISFMALGDVLYEKPDYIEAKNAYDSVDAGSLKDSVEQQRLTGRLSALEVIATNLETIHDEDSVQLVARMPEAQRIAFIKKTVRRLRRAQGLKDEDSSRIYKSCCAKFRYRRINGNAAATDLFAANTKGDWYFNNQTIKAAGVITVFT